MLAADPRSYICAAAAEGEETTITSTRSSHTHKQREAHALAVHMCTQMHMSRALEVGVHERGGDLTYLSPLSCWSVRVRGRGMGLGLGLGLGIDRWRESLVVTGGGRRRGRH